MHQTFLICPAFGSVMLISALAASPAVAAPGDGNMDLQRQIVELRAEVERLRDKNDDHWLTDQRAAEIRGLVYDVLADADTRASLLGSGMQSGWDSHPFIASSDGNFRLQLEGQLQVRFVYNNQDDDADDSHRWGFENRRTKIKFAGHIIDPSWSYKVTGAFSSSSGAFNLEDAYIGKNFGNGWKLKVGQFKPPFLREELVSSSKQLLVDRSLVNEQRNQDFSQGIQIEYGADAFRIYAMFHDGFGADNTGALVEDVEFAATGRGEVLLAGNWKQFDDFTSFRGEEFGLMIGGAVHYQKGESGTAAIEEEEFMWTVDASAEFGGANAFVAIVGRHLDEADVDRFGVVVQGGYFLTDDWEIFGRYEWYDYDTSGMDDINIATVGANYYMAKHNLKWTTDLGFALDTVESGSSGVGWRTDPAGEDNQIVFRSQLQLLF